MKIHLLHKVITLCFLVSLTIKGLGQTVLPTNTGPVGLGVTPVGWTIITGTTDISNQTMCAGVCPWEGTVENPPNDHEVWVSGYGFEAVGTTISDLTIGEDYSFSFYMAEIPSACVAEPVDEDGTLEVDLDGTVYLFPFTGGFDNSWSMQTIDFTATATTMSVTFGYETVMFLCWNVSFGEFIDLACDTLDTYVSATDVCLGDEVTLSAESLTGGVVSWDGGITDGIAFTPPLGTSIYTATSDVVDDCVFEVEITVFDYPEFEITASDDEICDGESITLSVDGAADTFVWDTPDIALDEPYYPEIGTHEFVLTGINGVCETEESIEIVVHENPTVDAIVDDATICLGMSVVFSGEGADSYTWDLGVSDGVLFTPGSSGVTTHTVVGINALTGCTGSDFVNLTVYDLPVIVADADEDLLCEGELVTLSASGAPIFEWDLGVEDGIAFLPPIGTTTYTVIGTSFAGCEGTASIDITVSPLPILTASSSDTLICEGEEIVLTADGAEMYEWDAGIVDGEAFIPVGVGIITYTVIGTSGPGCEGTETIDIIILANPIVTAAASPLEICEGESIIFTGAGADTYSWEDGIFDGIAFYPDGSGELEFTVTGIDVESTCSNTASITVTVHALPIVGATASLTEVCLGESIELNGTGAETYTWDAGISDGVSFTPFIMGPTTYNVTGTDANGCQSVSNITITVLDCEPVQPGFMMPTAVCVNACFTLQDTSTGSVIDWAWDFGGATDPNTSSLQHPTICADEPGSYNITLSTMSESGALSTLTKVLIVNDNPIIEASLDTIIELGGSANLIVSTVETGDFIWTPDYRVVCPDCPITTASPSQNQVYTIQLIDNNGCSTTDSVVVLVNPKLSIGVPDAFSPNGDGINDVLFVLGEGLQSISFVVFNRYGERIFETNDQQIGWDGTFLNQDENPGVFTWLLFYTTQDGKNGRMKGNTTLIR